MLKGHPRATLAALAALVGLVAGCGESPTEVYEAARAAAAEKDVAAFTAWFSDRSAALLRGLDEVRSETRGYYEYLKDPFVVLPQADVLAEDVRGNLAVLTVGRSERNAEQVHLVREVEGWRIDIVHAPRFWQPLATGK